MQKKSNYVITDRMGNLLYYQIQNTILYKYMLENDESISRNISLEIISELR